MLLSGSLDDMTPTLITKEDAATLLGVSVPRVYQLVDSGLLTKFKPQRGRTLRFDRDEVLALAAARKTFKPVRRAG